MRVLSFGGGVNSTGLLVGLVNANASPDLVLFADTGGELPDTYAHVAEMFRWATSRGIRFEFVTNAGRGQGATLEENCLMRRELPSLAYGFKGCSVKWKRQPMDRFLAEDAQAKAVWESGGKVTRLIGIDAGESHRAVLTEDKKFAYKYPLVEWGWDRDLCLEAIRSAGLKVPPKSSCFFCPARKKREVMRLKKEHPDLFKRCEQMEANSMAHTAKGLGRSWSWTNYAKADEAQGRLFPDQPDMPCDCMDGDSDQ